VEAEYDLGQGRWTPLAVFLAGAAIVNLTGPSLSWALLSPLFVGLFAGAVSAELGLLAIWTALGAGRWTLRIPLTYFLAVLCFMLLVMGFNMGRMGPLQSGGVLHDLALLPLVFLAAQLPLWIVRLIFGWRMVFAEGAEQPDAEVGQFSIGHLLGATALVAVSLGLAQLGPLEAGPLRSSDAVWLDMLATCGIVALASALSTVPCVWAVFISRRPLSAAWAIAAYTFAASGVLVFLQSALTGVSDFWAQTLVLALLTLGALMATMLTGLGVAHFFRYEMLRRGRKPRNEKPLEGLRNRYEE